MNRPIKKLADALKWKKMPQSREVVAVHCNFSMWNPKEEELKIQLVLTKRMDKHMDKLTNHITVQSAHKFEKDSRNGKHYVASAHQYLKLLFTQ